MHSLYKCKMWWSENSALLFHMSWFVFIIHVAQSAITWEDGRLNRKIASFRLTCGHACETWMTNDWCGSRMFNVGGSGHWGRAISKRLDKKTGREQASKPCSSMLSVSGPGWVPSCPDLHQWLCVLAVLYIFKKKEKREKKKEKSYIWYYI